MQISQIESQTHCDNHSTTRLLAQGEAQWLVNLNLNVLSSPSSSCSDLKTPSHRGKTAPTVSSQHGIGETPFGILKREPLESGFLGEQTESHSLHNQPKRVYANGVSLGGLRIHTWDCEGVSGFGGGVEEGLMEWVLVNAAEQEDEVPATTADAILEWPPILNSGRGRRRRGLCQLLVGSWRVFFCVDRSDQSDNLLVD